MINSLNNAPDTLVFFGPNGGGKGTQAKQLVQMGGYSHFEMGNALSEAVNDKVTIDKVTMTVGQARAKGILLPDGVIQAIVDKDLSQRIPGKRRIYDGVARTYPQAENLVTSLQRFENDY